ncbi:MAG: extracellular solute-binding protein [Rhizobium sp.]
MATRIPSSFNVNRRMFNKLALSSAVTLMASASWQRSVFAADDKLVPYKAANLDWKQFDGTEIALSGATHPWSSAILPLLPLFTELTGIKVKTDFQSESEFLTSLPIKLGAGSATPDVFMFLSYGQGIGAGWLEPVDAYYADKALCDLAWYEEDDILGAARGFPVWSDKQRYAFPITAESQIMFFNETMMNEKGQAVPNTFDELLTVAKALKTDDVAGIAMRAKGSVGATAASMGFLFSHGGQMVKDGRAAFDSPEGVAAMDMYGRLLREAGPIGIGTYDWYEVLNDYTQAACACATDSSNFATTIGDPSKSRVAGKTIFRSLVSDSKHPSTPYMSCWQACINSKSANKKAAFLFMLWATSKPTAALASAAGLATTRSSGWSSEAFKKAFGAQAADAALSSLSTANVSFSKAALFHPQASQIFDAFAIATNEIVTANVPAAKALKRGAEKANAAIRL